MSPTRKVRRNAPARFQWIAPAALFACALLVALPGASRSPRKTHLVQSGQSIAWIADYYGVSQRDLRELNKLGAGNPLRAGKKLRIPNVLRVPGKAYRVKKGDSLESIAKKHKRTVEALAQANKIGPKGELLVGRTLVIPDGGESGKQIKLAENGHRSIQFLRVRTGESARLRLYYRSGKMNRRNVQKLSKLARAKQGKNRVKRINSRLVELLQRVAERFPGGTIEIISGYRPQSTGNETQHAFGRAMDFRVSGVPLRKLFKFCKSLPRTGCGYYPKKNFIHMDARESKVSWVHPKPKRKQPNSKPAAGQGTPDAAAASASPSPAAEPPTPAAAAQE